jgi:hypothetical protein
MLVQGDADKKNWVNFQQRVDKAPEQVLRCDSNAYDFLHTFDLDSPITSICEIRIDTDIPGALVLNPFGQ